MNTSIIAGLVVLITIITLAIGIQCTETKYPTPIIPTPTNISIEPTAYIPTPEPTATKIKNTRQPKPTPTLYKQNHVRMPTREMEPTPTPTLVPTPTPTLVPTPTKYPTPYPTRTPFPVDIEAESKRCRADWYKCGRPKAIAAQAIRIANEPKFLTSYTAKGGWCYVTKKNLTTSEVVTEPRVEWIRIKPESGPLAFKIECNLKNGKEECKTRMPPKHWNDYLKYHNYMDPDDIRNKPCLRNK